MTNIDLASLTSAQGFKILGAAAGDETGYSVSNAGDINGDGTADIVVGVRYADPSSRTNAGAAYVIYGKNGGLSDIDLANFTPAQGFKISGAAAGGEVGLSVSNAGDINDDGIDDLVVGAINASPSGRAEAGAAYVIYGKNGGLSDIDLLSLTAENGFEISGAAAGDEVGRSVSGAGDINGDGIADLIVGASNVDPSGRSNAGAVYVIYGKNGGLNNIDLLNGLTQTQGFKISGAAADDEVGRSVSGAGDINGDGIADLVVGAQGADPSNRTNAGAAYVIYGKNGGLNNIDLLNGLTQTQGFKISGAATWDYAGWSVSNAGDINGDGIADLFVGAPKPYTDAGVAYAIYGKNGGLNDIDLLTLTAENGFKISGSDDDRTGISVSNAGDINGDGITDLFVGAVWADPSNRTDAGAAYVIYGKNGGLNDIDLASLGAVDGFKISGAAAGDETGWSVNAAGDINGDGITDLVVGAPGADPSTKIDAGATYVIYGNKDSDDSATCGCDWAAIAGEIREVLDLG